MEAQEQLDDLKRLMILLLIKLGSTSDEIAIALDVDASVVRKMIPARRIKKIANVHSE